ncbi:Hypothetical protein CINCED_3A006437 [Cinara cedri]|uniref:Uncharacterized protein n=1 Tax=Cinara cedri TaxID=506608 RepID=A0A5E4M6C4_9HEMI|nr:Hypothetical protein CINCED_3A006437 [Cinara cedri]
MMGPCYADRADRAAACVRQASNRQNSAGAVGRCALAPSGCLLITRRSCPPQSVAVSFSFPVQHFPRRPVPGHQPAVPTTSAARHGGRLRPSAPETPANIIVIFVRTAADAGAQRDAEAPTPKRP